MVFSTNFLCSGSHLGVKNPEELQTLIGQLLQRDSDLSRRLRYLKDTAISQSSLTIFSRNDRGAKEADDGESMTITPDGVDLQADPDKISLQETAPRFTFEDDLEHSPVYKRTKNCNSDASFTSSTIRPYALSILSGATLAEAIDIPLPVSSHEISNSRWYKFREPPPRDSGRGKMARWEETLSDQYVVLKKFLPPTLREATSTRKTGLEKMRGLSDTQFLELTTDVYDETLRRQGADALAGGSSYLHPQAGFHPKRNQARQKLATLPNPRFLDLVRDTTLELEIRLLAKRIQSEILKHQILESDCCRSGVDGGR